MEHRLQFADQLASHWEGGRWEVDATHDSIIVAGNGGDKPSNTQVSLFYNGGKDQYQIERTLAPDEEWYIDVGKLIRNRVADKNGNFLPADLTWGTYQFKDLSDGAVGRIFEGKVITDKTFGHAAYGCMICCGYPYLGFMWTDPLGIVVGDNQPQDVGNVNACTGNTDHLGGYYAQWWTDTTSIATANPAMQINGISEGDANNLAFGQINVGDGTSDVQVCPRANDQPSGAVKVRVPHHLVVTNDTTAVYCTNSVRRIITYVQVDVNGLSVGIIKVKETFDSISANSCNTNIRTTDTCTSTPDGTLPDDLKVGCNGVGGSCGFTATNQKWQYCPATGPAVTLAAVGDDVVHNDSITVGGSAHFATGTKIGPSGIIP